MAEKKSTQCLTPVYLGTLKPKEYFIKLWGRHNYISTFYPYSHYIRQALVNESEDQIRGTLTLRLKGSSFLTCNSSFMLMCIWSHVIVCHCMDCILIAEGRI